MKYKWVRWVAEWIGVMFFVGLCRLLPISWGLKMGRGLGSLAWKWDRHHREISLENLRKAYQANKTEADFQKISLGCFQFLGESMVEFANLPWLLRKENLNYFEVEGLEHLEAARKKGKGVIFLTAHFGNWEIMAMAMASLIFPFHVVARPLDNPLLDRWVNHRRSMKGNKVINKNQSIRKILSLLQKNEAVGFLLDQNTGKNDGVFVPFFNRPACTSKGLALIALRKEATVIPLFMKPRAKGGYSVFFDKEISIIRTGRLEEDIILNTQQFTSIIESVIREYPEKWLWVHQRWKTQQSSP